MIKILNLIIFILFLICSDAMADSSLKATPQECIQKCREAVEFLSKEIAKGPEAEKAALAYMGDKEKSRFVWKDTYVWVLCCKCNPPTNAAHPIKSKIVGPNLSGLKDKKGNLFYLKFCKVCEEKKGGWVEYWWPKVGEKKASRKLTYILSVPGTNYQVGAGVYDEKLSNEELNKLLK